MRTAATAMAAVLLLLTAHPTGAQPVDAPLYAELGPAGGASRYFLAASVDDLLASVPATSRPAIAAALRPDGSDRLDPLWGTLMAGAVQTRHESGDEGVTLWFNAVFDAGLEVRWRRVGGSWQAVDAVAVLGETLRGEPLAARQDGRVGWTSTTGSIHDALSTSVQRTRQAVAGQALERAFSAPSQARTAAARIALMRAAHGVIGVRASSQLPGYEVCLSLLRSTLSGNDEADAPALTPDVRGGLAAMGDEGRLALRAVAALYRPDGVSFVLQSPAAPGVVWFAHYANPAPGGLARLQSLAAVRTVALPTGDAR
jgi:hypothetical protein